MTRGEDMETGYGGDVLCVVTRNGVDLINSNSKFAFPSLGTTYSSTVFFFYIYVVYSVYSVLLLEDSLSSFKINSNGGLADPWMVWT